MLLLSSNFTVHAEVIGDFEQETGLHSGQNPFSIYRHSSSFSYLGASEKIVPGEAIFNKKKGLTCSAGWLFKKNDKIVLSTAGL